MKNRSEDLEVAIARRKKQAENRNILEKTSLVARFLGRGEEQITWSDEVEVHYQYSQGNVTFFTRNTIHLDCHGKRESESTTYSAYVKQGKKTLFHWGTFEGVICFIPGKWERALNTLYRKAQARKEERARRKIEKEKQESAARKRKERAKWDL